LGKFNYHTKIVYSRKAIDEFIDQTEQHYNVPAKNALFQFENERVVSFRPEENGTKIKSDELKKDIEESLLTLKTKPGSKRIVLQETVLKPEITLAKANDFGIEELIGVGESNYSGSIPERIHNVILAAYRFNGVMIPKDEEFSFNQIIGDISAATGYKQAYIIKGGKTVLGDGGGVCQVSTTLFRAALNTGLPITQRIAHAYRVGYYENDSKPGFDATVFNPTADFRFKNDTSAAILIQTEVDEALNILRFRFYGKKDGRAIQISSPTLWDVQPPPPPQNQDDPTLKKGVVKQVDFAAWGGKANFSYKVTRNGETLFAKDFYSSYRPWQAVFLVGTAD
jgi:vancomycin resistance protein YoaR